MAAVEDTLSNLPYDIREECILAIKIKRNNSTTSRYEGDNRPRERVTQENI
jgi:hypothetical protein